MRTLYLFCLMILLTACQGYRKQLEHAEAFKNAGMHDQALSELTALYQLHPDKPEVLIALKETASIQMNKYYSNVQMLQGSGRYQSALDALTTAENFQSEYEWLGLSVPFFADGLRNEIRMNMADDYFAQAEAALFQEKWEDALMYASLARRAGSRKPEIDYVETMAVIVPAYRRGEKAMELGLYQDAYYYFEKVFERDADFNDVVERMQECLRRASVTVSYVHLLEEGEARSRDKAIIASVQEEILELDNPFIRLVTRDDIELLLEEQKNAMGAGFADEIIVEAGQLLGAELLIAGEVVSSSVEVQPIREKVHKGYEGRTVIAKKVEYKEKVQSVKHMVSFRYRILDAETGEILVADNIPYKNEVQNSWVEFGGDPDLLHPGEWKFKYYGAATDMVDTDEDVRKELQRLIRARRGTPTEAELEQEFIEYIGVKIAEELGKYADVRNPMPLSLKGSYLSAAK